MGFALRLILLALTMAFAAAPDALGNIRTRNDGSQTAAIAYDAVKNRVASATVNGSGWNFTYDPGITVTVHRNYGDSAHN